MRNFVKATAVGLICVMGLGACQTTDPYTGEQQTSNATRGAVIGAAGGAVVGALTNRNQAGRNALIGAGIGALAGGLVGNYMDNQEAELRDRLRTSGVSVSRVGDNIYLNMENDILFDTGSAYLHPQAENIIESVATVLKEYRQTYVNVNGFADTVGTRASNQVLSQQRAEGVADALVRNGVEPVRISPRGYGETNLRVPPPDGVDEPRNRRVEIVLEPVRG
nr:MAG: glycine zipper 2TM domain-containing protein [Hyphomicrobiales bacterium]